MLHPTSTQPTPYAIDPLVDWRHAGVLLENRQTIDTQNKRSSHVTY